MNDASLSFPFAHRANRGLFQPAEMLREARDMSPTCERQIGVRPLNLRRPTDTPLTHRMGFKGCRRGRRAGLARPAACGSVLEEGALEEEGLPPLGIYVFRLAA